MTISSLSNLNNLTTDYTALLQVRCTKQMLEAAKSVLLEMATYEAIKPIVESCQKKVLKSLRPTHRRTGEVIIKPKKAFFMSDQDFNQYLTLTHNKYLEAGFKVKRGYCPMLIANNKLIDAKKQLINLMEPITGLNANQILSAKNGLVFFDEMVSLTLRLFAPYIESENIREFVL